MSRFFIGHPIFAWVIAILIVLAGVIALFNLGIESYPSVVPPQVVVGASYPGASAETTEKAVTQVIEQQLTGIDHLLYFASTSSSSGGSNITLTFETGTDPVREPAQRGHVPRVVVGGDRDDRGPHHRGEPPRMQVTQA